MKKPALHNNSWKSLFPPTHCILAAHTATTMKTVTTYVKMELMFRTIFFDIFM